MKRNTLERIWFWFVLSGVVIICVIGAYAMFDENPMAMVRYAFVVVFAATPINILMIYLLGKAKD